MGMGMDKLTFDPTDANSLAASSTVGSYTLSGTGVSIGAVSDALKVNFTNSTFPISATDLDIRDLVFATDKVDVSGSTVELGATTLAALESITVVATDLDIRNLVFATDKVDVSGSSVELGATTLAALETITVVATDLDIRNLVFADDKVDVSGSSVELGATTLAALENITATVNDAALANTAALSTAVAPTTTATNFPAALANRKYLTFQNLAGNCFVGGSTATAATGLRLASGAMLEGLRIGPAITLRHVMAAGTGDLRILELS